MNSILACPLTSPIIIPVKTVTEGEEEGPSQDDECSTCDALKKALELADPNRWVCFMLIWPF